MLLGFFFIYFQCLKSLALCEFSVVYVAQLLSFFVAANAMQKYTYTRHDSYIY